MSHPASPCRRTPHAQGSRSLRNPPHFQKRRRRLWGSSTALSSSSSGSSWHPPPNASAAAAPAHSAARLPPACRPPTSPRRRLIAFAKVARHDCSIRCCRALHSFREVPPLPTSTRGGAPHALTAAGGRQAMNAAAAAAAESLPASPGAPLPDAMGTVGCCTPTEAKAASVGGPGADASCAPGAGPGTAVLVAVLSRGQI